MRVAVLVDTERLDREAIAEVSTACLRVEADLIAFRDARDARVSPPLIVGALRRGERRLSSQVLELMTEVAPDAAVLLLSDDALIRPVVATHGGRVTLLSRPVTPARIRGTVRMLLGERCKLRDEHLDGQVWSAVVGSKTSRLSPPAIRRDSGSGLTAVFPLEPGWSGAEELCDDADLIAQARIDDDERTRRLREILGNAAGMIHLAANCRQWIAYWPTTRSPLVLCSPLRLPRICNVAEAASRQVLTLGASPGDLVIALAREEADLARLNVTDGGAAVMEQLEGQVGLAEPGMLVELR